LTHNRHDTQTEITYKFKLSFLLSSFMFLEKVLTSRELFVHLTTHITHQRRFTCCLHTVKHQHYLQCT